MCREIFKKNKFNTAHAALAAGIILIMYVAVLLICQVAPFGDNTFLMYDLKRQYADYYAYYRSVLLGDNDIFYSFSTTLGSGMIGFFAYYMMSPFLIILSLFRQESLYIGITIVIGLKLMLSAFIMDYVLQKLLSEVNCILPVTGEGIAILAGAVSWAFSGFLFAHSMNMMWMDVVILFPLYVLCLENLIAGGMRVPFSVILFVMLVLNYYITYQVLLFTAIWTIIRLIVIKSQHPFRRIIDALLSTLVSVLTSAVLMVPTFLELMNSPKDITELGLKLTGKNLTIVDLFSKFPTLSYDYIEARFGFPQVFCGVLFVLLIFMYMLSRKIPLRERAGMLVFMAVMVASLCFDLLNLIWHAGMEPSGHPYRQAFIFVFVIILCAVRAFISLREDIGIIKVVFSVGLFLFMLMLARRGMYDHFSDLTFYANLALIASYSAVFGALYLAVKKHSSLFSLLLMAALLLIQCLDLTANAVYTYHNQAMMCEKASYYRGKISSTKAAVDYVKENDTSFYRMEDLNPRQQNDSLQYAYNGITHYSSAGMIYVRYFLQRLGFNDDTLYTHYGRDNTETADSLLGIKYILSDGTFEVHPDYEKIYDGEVSACQNPYALSVATGTSDFDITGITDAGNIPDNSLSHVPSLDPFSLQEEIYSRLLGKEVSLFEEADVDESDRYISDDKPRCDFIVRAQKEGEMYMYFDGLIGAGESLSVFVDGEFLTTYGNAACTKILKLGYYLPGDTVEVSIQGEGDEDDFGRALFVTEDVEALSKASAELSQMGKDIQKISSSSLKIMSDECDGIFLSIPYQKGFSAMVDGKKTEPLAVYDSLTYIPLPDKTEHVITMRFVPDGFYIGLIATVLGIVCFILLFFSDRKGKAIMKTADRPDKPTTGGTI